MGLLTIVGIGANVLALVGLSWRHTAKLKRTVKDLTDFKFALDRASILAMTDAHGKITYVNDKFCEISRYSRAELLGRDHRIINSGHHDKEFFRRLWSTISSGKIWEGEVCNRTKDGELYWVHTFIVPFLNRHGNPYQYISIRTDITARKRFELSSRLKSEFLANMSHEIRTPLNSIVGMTDMLTHSTLSKDQSEYVDGIRRSSASLRGLIDDVLDLSKVEAGRLELERARFDLKELLLGVERMFRRDADLKRIRLSIEGLEAIDGEMLGDPARVQQVVVNLVGNAIKFTAKGSVTIRVSLAGEGQRPLLIEIEDTGVGVDPKSAAMLFEPFVQLDSSTARKYGGSGLGLSICKRLVEIMGGEIGVEGVPGSGSKFWFALPFDRPLTDAVLEFEKHPADTIPKFPSSLRVLLAEDMVTNQRVIGMLLGKLKLTVDSVASGTAAVDAVFRQTYDLVLMDCHMPELDGYAATQAIRSEFARRGERGPVIIALTASAMAGDREKCLKAGMDDYLPKPFGLKELGVCLRRWVPESREEEPSIDWSRVERLMSLGDQGATVFDDMVGLFIKNVPTRIEQIRKARELKDAAGTAREAHGLKSAVCYIGAVRIEKLCDEIGGLANAGHFDAVDSACVEIEREYRVVSDSLKNSFRRSD